MIQKNPGIIRFFSIRFVLALLAAMTLLSPAVSGVDLVRQALSDRAVLYIYDDPMAIDWATIYFLNDAYDCQVDLLTLRPGGEFRLVNMGDPERGLMAYTAYGDSHDSAFLPELFGQLFSDRRPDLVLISELSDSLAFNPLLAYLKNLPTDPEAIFEISSIYRWLASPDSIVSDGPAVINTEELFGRYRDRMLLELPALATGSSLDQYQPPRFARYQLIQGHTEQSSVGGAAGLLPSGGSLRLIATLDSFLGSGVVESALLRQARNYVTFFSMAQNSIGVKRVQNMVFGYKALIALSEQSRSLAALANKGQLTSYLASLQEKAQTALLKEINLDWSGDIIRRDSPHGPKLKFRAELSVNGPQEVELSYIRFHPFWDSTVVTLDSVSRKVHAHQAYVSEYLIDIDPAHLESELPDSLLFTAEIVYNQLTLPLISSVAVREVPKLSLEFLPGFHFVPPVARIDVDQVVASMNWKVIIRKPYNYSGTVTLDLQTPRGLFAGAYKTTWKLDRGRTSETVRIPFSVSNLFEQGIQHQSIKLLADNQVIDVDTGIIRIASCNVSDKVRVGLFPDSTGLLEDILRMTRVAFQPMTDRALITSDLNAYEVLVFGSGCFRRYPSLREAKDRIEDYLRRGGSLIVFGQPADWPEGILPVSMVPGSERIAADKIINRLPEGTVVSEPYEIKIAQLLTYMSRERLVWPAVISPAETVLRTPSQASLLSVSRIGEGQIIYCGLPLVEMIEDLNLDAIHLLANLLNY